MFIPGGSAIPASGYDINNSLRFRSSASASLSRTPASASNLQKWTYSAWVKRGALGTGASFYQNLLDATGSPNAYHNIRFVDDTLLFTLDNTVSLATTALFRDPSAWYHIVVVWDTPNATAADRMIMYVNGTRQTVTLTFGSYPAQNSNGQVNSTNAHAIGRYVNGNSQFFDGYITEVNFIDGQALTPSSFGTTDAATGVWAPAKYTGTYGTNGYYLKFSDVALTSGSNAGLGKDFSGNTNYWNTNNISVTAGVTYDAMTDSPTLTSATVGNYAVLNPLDAVSTSTPTFANLRTTYSSSIASRKSTIVMTSGKWYTEWNITGSGGGGGNLVIQTVGIISPTATSNAPSVSGVGYYSYGDGTNSQKFVSGVASTYGTYWGNAGTYTLGAALDITGGTITFYLNGVSQGAITLPSNTDGWVFVNSNGTNTGTCTVDNNFGQRPFTYTPPSGFVALNTFNLPNSTVVKGNTVMDATLYTGTGANATITNAAGFRPDLVWVKVRSQAGSHVLTDSNRGANKQLFSNLTNAEATATNKITGFTSTGFTLGADDGSGTGDANFNGQTYVGWQWQAGQGTNTSGTGTGGITSVTQSVNTTAGFSIVTYTGSGANGTVTHGLGVAPKMVIAKVRSTGNDWYVYHSGLTSASYYINLNATGAQALAASVWNGTAPTSSVFSLGSSSSANASGATYVAYCWAEIAGFSAFGSYTGNGSTNGVFVYTGFRPAYLLIKRSSGVEDWFIFDNKRLGYNVDNNYLYTDLNNVEGSLDYLDILSNGFKLRSTSTSTNASGSTYIYAAFAENPFKNALAR
jgi:hypothetical protein